VPRDDEPQAETTPTAIKSTATTRPTGPSLATEAAPSNGAYWAAEQECGGRA
jgi:hypothetical protein